MSETSSSGRPDAPAQDVGAPQALAAAQRVLSEGRRLDMRELADSLGVARSTLYRWTGGREQLLVDAFWAMALDGLQRIDRDLARHTGVRRVGRVAGAFAEAATADVALNAFVQNETHAALRVLTTRGSVQDRFVDWFDELIREQARAGHLVLDVDSHLVAYTLVRLVESFVYNDAVAAIEPRLEEAQEMIAFVLRSLQPAAD